jgi:hypothetical protein
VAGSEGLGDASAITRGNSTRHMRSIGCVQPPLNVELRTEQLRPRSMSLIRSRFSQGYGVVRSCEVRHLCGTRARHPTFTLMESTERTGNTEYRQ